MLADFKPLQAWRYDPKKVTIDQVIAPPYDIISPDEQNSLYQRSNHNCIRLILNQREASDRDQNNPYTRANQFFKSWQQEKILVKESKPAYYLYRQFFKDPHTQEEKSRTAIMGRLRLEPFEKGVVVPHEKTLSKAREDRKRLLEATGANFSPVFGLYDDPDAKITGLYKGVSGEAPLFDAVDDKGVRHVVWALTDAKLTGKIHEEFQNKKIYIADGHHRYTTALHYAEKQRLLNPHAGELDSDYVLMALVEFHDPGMILFATHRWLSQFDSFDEAQLVEKLKIFFSVEEIPMNKLIKELDKPASEKIQFGLLFKSMKSYQVTLNDFKKVRQEMPADQTDRWCQMDVAILSHFILKKLWALPEDKWESVIRYTHSTKEAISEVENGKFAVTFLLKPPQVEVLRDMGETKELLPQKSTYFWPKLASGLVFYSHH